MYFDPISTWLVSLIADGIVVAGNKGKCFSVTEYEQKRINEANASLNANIRRIKDKYGLVLAEAAYKQIQMHIQSTLNTISFHNMHGQINIDLDNQEYIIDIFDECAKRYSQYESVEKYQKKAEWYRKAASEAREKKAQYAIELEETRKKEAEQREKEQVMSNLYLIIGLAISVAFLFFFFAS